MALRAVLAPEPGKLKQVKCLSLYTPMSVSDIYLYRPNLVKVASDGTDD